MEKKKNSKINIFTIILFLVIIVIAVLVYLTYKEDNKQLTDNENKTSEFVEIPAESIDLNNYNFELNSKGKYTIITDLKWQTMQNDGGSHSSLYYQLDLENNIVRKIKEEFKANLGGTPSNKKYIIYTKNINNAINEEAKKILEEIIESEDVNETNNYNFFTILNLNSEKNIHNTKTIERINDLLKKIDE